MKLPKFETKLTAVTVSCHGKKVQVFLDLPVINGKAVLPAQTFDKLAEEVGAEKGSTVTIG